MHVKQKQKTKKKEKWVLFVNATLFSFLSKQSFLYLVKLLLPLSRPFNYALNQNMCFMDEW